MYRKIFKFLLDFAPTDKSGVDRAIEREVAAALESVFPRLGLKAFVQLNFDEKTAQLMELGRIVYGIRLFNKAQNRGGAGISNIDELCPQLAGDVERDINKEVILVTSLCNKYQSTIVKAHLHKRKMDEAEKKRAQYNDAKADFDDLDMDYRDNVLVNEYLLDRWSSELANRRQYLSFLRSLQEEIHVCVAKIKETIININSELQNLQTMVTGRAAVPKEQVYPRFDNLASTWMALWEEYHLLRSRNNTYLSLKKYKGSYIPMLTEKVYAILGGVSVKGRSLHADSDDDAVALGEGGGDGEGEGEGEQSFADTFLSEDYERSSSPEQKKGGMHSNSASADAKGSTLQDFDDDDKEVKGYAHHGGGNGSESKMKGGVNIAEEKKESKGDMASIETGAVLLTVQNTAGFMLLPLELQGFCPWTIVKANGLLVPGKPSLGVIKYDNLYYVCEHSDAIKAFIKEPEMFVSKIRQRAAKSPELIHLLRLQNYFPSASIARLIQRPEFDNNSSKSLTKDASTGTPVHFVEKYIDPNYQWNEWELRRNVLKVVNLKNCKTTGQQTDSSHFRRDNETQVYVPRAKETQTKVDKSTNPVITTTYMSGLRGKMNADSSAGAVSKYIKKDSSASSSNKSEASRGARVIKLELEL